MQSPVSFVSPLAGAPLPITTSHRICSGVDVLSALDVPLLTLQCAAATSLQSMADARSHARAFAFFISEHWPGGGVQLVAPVTDGKWDQPSLDIITAVMEDYSIPFSLMLLSLDDKDTSIALRALEEVKQGVHRVGVLLGGPKENMRLLGLLHDADMLGEGWAWMGRFASGPLIEEGSKPEASLGFIGMEERVILDDQFLNDITAAACEQAQLCSASLRSSYALKVAAWYSDQLTSYARAFTRIGLDANTSTVLQTILQDEFQGVSGRVTYDATNRVRQTNYSLISWDGTKAATGAVVLAHLSAGSIEYVAPMRYGGFATAKPYATLPACEVGHVFDEARQLCTPCPVGYYQPKSRVASATCLLCPDHFHSDAGAEFCHQDGTPWWQKRESQVIVGLLCSLIGVATLVRILFVLYRHAKRKERAKFNSMLEKLREAEAEAAAAHRADTAKEGFLRYIMHEIRIPFHVITMGIDALLLRQDTMPEEDADTLLTMKHCGEMMIEVLNSVLDLQKITKGNLELNLEPHPVGTVLELMRRPIHAHAARNKVQFSIVEANEDLKSRYINADMARLRQVVANLVYNAIMSSGHGGSIVLRMLQMKSGQLLEGVVIREGEKTRTVTKMLVADSLLFEVKDSGCGVTEEDMGQLFQNFSEVGSYQPHHLGGSGLGLVICKDIVELHGGWMAMKSTPNIGSMFQVVLPLASTAPTKSPPPCPKLEIPEQASVLRITPRDGPGESPRRSSELSKQATVSFPLPFTAKSPTPQSPSPRTSFTLPLTPSTPGAPPTPTAASKPLAGLRIFLVDDVPLVLKIGRKLLEGAGATVETATNGVEAIARYKDAVADGTLWDLTLLDKEMPEMDGHQAVKEIREMNGCGKGQHVVLGLTGNALKSDIANFRAHGVDDVITKPLFLPKLLSMLVKYGVSLSNKAAPPFDPFTPQVDSSDVHLDTPDLILLTGPDPATVPLANQNVA